MMFVDASAIVAILAREPEGTGLAARLDMAKPARTSALAIYEASLAIARKRNIEPGAAYADVLMFVDEAQIELLVLDGATAASAIDAHARYGRGRHKAALNMGDCFAYACAKLSGAEMLYKGDDFTLTDMA